MENSSLLSLFFWSDIDGSDEKIIMQNCEVFFSFQILLLKVFNEKNEVCIEIAFIINLIYFIIKIHKSRNNNEHKNE